MRSFGPPERDPDGQLIGQTVIEPRRHRWTVEKTEWLAQRDAKLRALRTGEVPIADLVRQHPELAPAAVGVWLGQRFAESMIERAEDRERIIALVRERMAHAVGRGEPIRVPAQVISVDADRGTTASPARARGQSRPPVQREA